jgi:hypothetical protein
MHTQKAAERRGPSEAELVLIQEENNFTNQKSLQKIV